MLHPLNPAELSRFISTSKKYDYMYDVVNKTELKANLTSHDIDSLLIHIKEKINHIIDILNFVITY